MAIVKKEIKFNLRIDGVEVATLDELKNHLTKELVDYLKDGRLTKWLVFRDADLANKIANISIDQKSDNELLASIFATLGFGDSAYAQNNLGLMYATGKGVAKNAETAVSWFSKSAEQGNVAAQYNLGLMYQNGYGVAKNAETAVSWYSKAVEQYHPVASVRLCSMYLNGDGVAENEETALYWQSKLAEKDKEKSKEILRKMYLFNGEN